MARVSIDQQLAKIRKAKAALEKQEKTILKKSQGKVIARIVQLASDNLITADQIRESLQKFESEKQNGDTKKKPVAANKGKVAPKYRNPANPDQTWTGRGRTPDWAQALKNAGTLDSALIKTLF